MSDSAGDLMAARDGGEVRMLPPAVAGALVAAALWLLGLATGAGLFVRWEALPPPPQPAVAVAETYVDAVVVRAEDGRLFRCGELYRGAQAGCWRPSDLPPPPDPAFRRTTWRGCEAGALPYWPTAGTPADLRACVRVSEGYIDMGSDFIYATDGAGRVWRWQKRSLGGGEGLSLVCLPPLAGAVTFLGGLGLGWLRARAARGGGAAM